MSSESRTATYQEFFYFINILKRAFKIINQNFTILAIFIFTNDKIFRKFCKLISVIRYNTFGIIR